MYSGGDSQLSNTQYSDMTETRGHFQEEKELSVWIWLSIISMIGKHDHDASLRVILAWTTDDHAQNTADQDHQQLAGHRQSRWSSEVQRVLHVFFPTPPSRTPSTLNLVVNEERQSVNTMPCIIMVAANTAITKPIKNYKQTRKTNQPARENPPSSQKGRKELRQ
jgi:hypothetical protein